MKIQAQIDALNKIRAKKEQVAFEAESLGWELDNDLCPLTAINADGDIIDVPVVETPRIQRLRGSVARVNNLKISLNRQKKIILAPAPVSAVVHAAPRTPRARRHGEGSRSSAASGDGNSDPEPDPERRAQPLSLHDQASLADLLKISKKSVQNIYSKTPWLLPPAISIPGARGPRWTPEAVQEWLQNRPQHTHKPFPSAPKRKAGRPRIALVSGGAK